MLLFQLCFPQALIRFQALRSRFYPSFSQGAPRFLPVFFFEETDFPSFLSGIAARRHVRPFPEKAHLSAAFTSASVFSLRNLLFVYGRLFFRRFLFAAFACFPLSLKGRKRLASTLPRAFYIFQLQSPES